jgi:hypothetical protein
MSASCEDTKHESSSTSLRPRAFLQCWIALTQHKLTSLVLSQQRQAVFKTALCLRGSFRATLTPLEFTIEANRSILSHAIHVNLALETFWIGKMLRSTILFKGQQKSKYVKEAFGGNASSDLDLSTVYIARKQFGLTGYRWAHVP